MTICSICNKENEPAAKFCEFCGSALAQEKESFGNGKKSSELAVGDKNVIAGDVIAKQETFKIAGAATIIQNEDQTKKMVSCHVCGRYMTILQNVDCPECGQPTCSQCIDPALKICLSCVRKRQKERENVYVQQLRNVYEDGKVSLEERMELNALQKQLNISGARAAELEDLIKSGSMKKENVSVLSTYAQLTFNKALDTLYDTGDCKTAYTMLKSLYEKFHQNEDVLSAYLYAAIRTNQDEAVKIIENNFADVPGIHISCIDLDLQRKDLVSVESHIQTALNLWPDNPLILCKKVIVLTVMFDELKEKVLLEQAKRILDSLPEPENKLQASWIHKAKYTVAYRMGEEIPDMSPEYCKENNLYFHLAKPAFDGFERSWKPEELVTLTIVDVSRAKIGELINAIAGLTGMNTNKIGAKLKELPFDLCKDISPVKAFGILEKLRAVNAGVIKESVGERNRRLAAEEAAKSAEHQKIVETANNLLELEKKAREEAREKAKIEAINKAKEIAYKNALEEFKAKAENDCREKIKGEVRAIREKVDAAINESGKVLEKARNVKLEVEKYRAAVNQQKKEYEAFIASLDHAE